MSIIDEMRNKAESMQFDGSGLHGAAYLCELADTLESLNLLAVVPVGNRCLLRHADNGYMLADDGQIYQRGEHGEWWSMKDPFQYIVGVDMFVQPVRLVPLAELGKESE